MARRRSPILDRYLQYYFANKQAEQQAELARETARLNEGINTEQQLLGAGLRDPLFGLRLSRRGRPVAGVDPTLFEPGQQEITAPVTQKIAGAKQLMDVPSGEAVLGDIASRGPIRELGPLTQALNLRNQRVDDIIQTNQFEDDRKIALAGGERREVLRQENVAANEFLPDVLNRANQTFDQETGNLIERETATRPGEVARAGAIAGASESGQQQAHYNPDFVKARLEEFAAQEAIRQQNNQPTDAQARAAGLKLPLVQADIGARMLEEGKGPDGKPSGEGPVALNLGTQTLGNTPYIAGVLPNTQRQYLQNAQNFLNIATLIMTGVTARPDEYKRYTSTLFALAGDDVQTIAQKRAARQQFIKSVEQRAQSGGQMTPEQAQAFFDSIIAGIQGTGTPQTPGQITPEQRIQQELQRRGALPQ